MQTRVCVCVSDVVCDSYKGYGGSTVYAGPHADNTPLDSKGRRACTVRLSLCLSLCLIHSLYLQIVAIDAAFYPLLSVANFRRETVKAFAGFSLPDSVLAASYPALVTGNWCVSLFLSLYVCLSHLRVC